MRRITQNWRNILARLPLPTLALAASYGVYSFSALFVPEWVAIIQAAAYELTYIGLSIVDVPERARRRRAIRISLSAVAVSVVYNSAAGYYARNPQDLIGLPWYGELALAIAHGAPLAIVAYLVADLLFHTWTIPRHVLSTQRRALVRRLVAEVRRGRQIWETTGKQLAEKGNALLSAEMELQERSARFAAESARLSDLARMEEAKSAQAQEELRRERERGAHMSAEVRTAQEEVVKLRGLVEEQSAMIEASDTAAGLNVRAMAQALRDEGLSLRTIGAILGVSDKTVRNWTEAVHTNGRES